MKHLAVLFVTGALISHGFAQDSKQREVATVSLVISGTIKNFDEFVSRVVPETYIQLVPMPSDGTITAVNKFADGKLLDTFFDSDLVTLSVPKTAFFKFIVPNTSPGKYFLAAQRLNVGWARPSEGPMFLTSETAIFIIDVPEGTKSPFTVNAGDLIVRIHNPR